MACVSKLRRELTRNQKTKCSAALTYLIGRGGLQRRTAEVKEDLNALARASVDVAGREGARSTEFTVV